MYIFKQEQIINQQLSRLFPFFERPENLSKLTTNWLSFKIKTAFPLDMKEGAEFEYKIKLLGIPMSWKTRIVKYSPRFPLLMNNSKVHIKNGFILILLQRKTVKF